MSDPNSFKANVFKICLHSFLTGTRPFLPIMFVYFSSLGLSFAQIGSLFSVMAISSLVFEIPAGSFSDRFGAKYSIMFSSLIFSFVFFAVGYFEDFYAFVLIFIAWGAAKAFYSGSDVTLIIESLKIQKRELKTSKYIGYKWSSFYGGLCFGGLLSPVIIVFGKEYAFYFSSVLYFLSIFLVATIRQPTLEKENAESIHFVKTAGDYILFLKRGKDFLLTHALAKYLLILNVILVTCSMVFFQYLQHILKEANVAEENFGYYYAVFTFCAAVVSRKSHTVDNSMGMKNSILLVFLVTLVSLFGSLCRSPFFLALTPIVLMQVQAGLSIPLMTTYLNKFIDSHHRTTLNSMKSFSGGVTLAVISSGVGYLADMSDFRVALAILGVFTFVSCMGPFLKVAQRA